MKLPTWTNKQSDNSTAELLNTTDLLVQQLQVPGLDDEPLEGGVVWGGQLHPDLPPRGHQAGAEFEEGWRTDVLWRVAVTRGDGWMWVLF